MQNRSFDKSDVKVLGLLERLEHHLQQIVMRDKVTRDVRVISELAELESTHGKVVCNKSGLPCNNSLACFDEPDCYG